MKKRVLYFDILKVLAIFLVLLIHVISEYWDNLDVNSNNFIILSIIDSISRFCVPVYLMISGALFLNEEKEITIKDILKKYLPRVILLFVFWNLTYGILNRVVLSKKNLTLAYFGKLLLNTILGKGLYHLYFLPIIICFYLCVPALKRITKESNREELKYLIILLFIFTCFNRLLKYAGLQLEYPFVFGEYVIYFILGYYLNTFTINKKNTKAIYVLGFIGLLITIFGTILLSRDYGKTDVLFKYMSFNVVMYSASVFLFAKNKFNSFNPKVLNILMKTNFGMYLIHGLVLGFLEKLGMFTIFDKLTIPVSILLSTIVLYIVSLVVTFILVNIPIVKNFVSLERKKTN